MPAIQGVLIAAAVLGHLAFWIAALNRIHGIGWPERLVMKSEKVMIGLMLLSLVGLALFALRLEGILQDPLTSLHRIPALAVYFWLCFGMGVRVTVGWFWRNLRGNPPHFVSYRREILRVERELGQLPAADFLTRLFARLPGNQIFHLELAEKTLQLPYLAAELDGLVIVHLTDLHLTGHVTRDYYELLVDRANACQPDIVALTGDLLDNPDCVPWISAVFGRLEAAVGVYYVLGNHEKRLDDVQPVHQAFAAAGIQHLGGQAIRLTVRDLPIVVAGTAVPWFPPAPNLPPLADPADRQEAFRLLLSHSPDQIYWAARRGFDLVVAGHTHGGQICPPPIGPILGHSLYGLDHCSGVHYRRPTVLHASRGTCQTQPLRINCRPELVKLVLRSPGTVTEGDEAVNADGDKRLPACPRGIDPSCMVR